jgi:hypothetical protein
MDPEFALGLYAGRSKPRPYKYPGTSRNKNLKHKKKGSSEELPFLAFTAAFSRG